MKSSSTCEAIRVSKLVSINDDILFSRLYASLNSNHRTSKSVFVESVIFDVESARIKVTHVKQRFKLKILLIIYS